DIDARQPSDPHREVLVGIRPIDDPPSLAARPARSEPEAAMKARVVIVFEADEVELAFLAKLLARSAFARKTAEPAESLRQRRARAKHQHGSQQSGTRAHDSL